MRRFLVVSAFAAALAVTAPALAIDKYLGTITSSGVSTTNLTTATAFSLSSGWVVSIQCDADAYIAEAPSDTPPTVTSSNGLRILQNVIFPISLIDRSNPQASSFAVAVLPVSGTVNCKVARFDG